MSFYILDESGEATEEAFLSVLEQFQGIERQSQRAEACEDDCEFTQRDGLERTRGEGFVCTQALKTWAEENPVKALLLREAEIADRFFESLTSEEYRKIAGLAKKDRNSFKA